MTARPARLLAACTALLLVAGLGTALPADAKAKPKATKTGVTVSRAVAGRTVTLTATVKPRVKVGTVRFTAAGRTVRSCGKVKVRKGKARCTTRFATTGRRAVAARYSGRAKKYKASTGRRTVAVVAAPKPAPAKPAPTKAAPPKAGTIVGSTGSCTTSTGALVAVDYKKWSGPIVRGCATNLTSGRTALTSAGFTITNTARFAGFICRLGNNLFDSGRQRPTAAEDPCGNPPPASAYWSFWTAAKGVNTWTYSSTGADSDVPAKGSVEAWTFGATDTAGATGKPAFTPSQVRAGLPASAAKLRSLQARVLAAPTSPDQGAAATYLVDGLVDGTHYDLAGSTTPDYGLTIDGAFALAADGLQDEALGRVTNYVRDHVSDYTALGGPYAEYADGGSTGKTALLAEITGNNPRSFGGFDLVKALADQTCSKTDPATYCGGKGEYRSTSSVFAHTLGVLAQLRAGETRAAQAPIAFLLSQQAAAGGFVAFKGSAVADTDTTAMAAMTLALVPGRTARTALAKALKWLAGQQRANGSFPNVSGDSVNSAGLSIQALTLDAETYSSQLAKGRRFLGSAQNGDGGFDISASDDGSDIRASAQALGGIALVPFGSVLRDLRSQDDAVGGADYLVDQLVGGDHYETTYEGTIYPDQGSTADAVFALLATGGHEEDVEAMLAYLENQVDAYAAPDGGEFGDGPYSGGLAKLALVAEATGGDPHDFGDTDLLTILKAKVCTAAIAGAYSPCTAAGDFFNAGYTVSQALGVLALQASTVAADHMTFTSPAVVRLRQVQCADGGFASVLITGTTPCVSDTDSTGFAVQALATVPNADAVLGRAQHYLEKAQKQGGTFASDLKSVNANSTALGATGLQTLITALRSETVDPPGPKTIAPITSYQAALGGLHTFAVPSGGYGVTDNSAPNVRASTQAVLAAAQGNLVTLSGASVASTPRDGFVADPGTPPAGGTPRPNGPSATTSNGAADEPIAETGVTAGTQLGWALAMVLAGMVLAFAGRRRVAGRHRTAGMR